LSEHRYDSWLESVDMVWHIEGCKVAAFTPEAFALESGSPIKTREIMKLLGFNNFKWRKSDLKNLEIPSFDFSTEEDADSSLESTVKVHELRIVKSDQLILDEIDFQLHEGDVLAVVGTSGAGKSTLLHSLIGDFTPHTGSVTLTSRTASSLNARDLLGLASLVPQQPGQLFVGETVSAECEFADKWRGLTPGSTLLQLSNFDVGIELDTHPRDLSAGQQLWLAISIALAAKPKLLLLDEPTRGLDYVGKEQLLNLLRERRAEKLITVWATHDLEAAADISNKLVLLSQGKQVSYGPPNTHHHPTLAKASAVSNLIKNVPFLSLGQLKMAIGKN
jgi:energy-coupling factor transport system ATP-binding protein